MKTKITRLCALISLFSCSLWLSAQENFTVRYTFNSNGVPQITSTEGVDAANVTFGGNKLGTVTYVSNSGANVLNAPIIQNNATNYNTNYIQMDIEPANGYSITVSDINVRHRSNETDNANFFRIGCGLNGAKPATNNVQQSTVNLPLTAAYSESSFSPGASASTAFQNETFSAYLCARGNTNTTFNWFIDEVEITGTYQEGGTPYPIVFDLDTYKGSKITKWGWDLKGSGVNEERAPVYYGTQANIIRFPIFAPSHAENGAIDRTLYETKLAQLKNILAIRPDVEVFISLKLSGATTFPDWVGSNVNGRIFGNVVAKPDPEKFSELLADFLAFMDDEGIPIDYFAPGNEVALALDAPRHYETMKLLRAKLADRGISNNFRVVGPDAYSHNETIEFMDEYESLDPNLEYIDILGTHYYASVGSEATWEDFKDSHKKPVWYTEAGFGPWKINGVTTFPSMAGLRKRFAQVCNALNGGANNIVYWQGAGTTEDDIFDYFKINFIDQVYGYQPVESSITFWGQAEDHFNVPFFQAFREGNSVIIYAINPRNQAFTHTMSFDKSYDVNTISKEVFVGTTNDDTYSRTTQNLNANGNLSEISTTYPPASITLYRFELPNSITAVNTAPVVRNGQQFNYEATNQSSTGAIVGKVLVDDNDADELTYRITGGTGASAFGIGSLSGLITLQNASAIPNGASSVSLNVVANDTKSNSAARTVTIQLENNNTTSFTPDPNKTYYIDSAGQNVRLASTGDSQDVYSTSLTTTGEDVEWKFVQRNANNWYLERAAGGTLSRLRSNNTAVPNMIGSNATGSWTYFEIDERGSTGTYYLTLPNGPVNFKRLYTNSSKAFEFVTTSNTGSWVAYRITEVPGNATATSDFVLAKRNASDYAIDGGNGAVADRSLELFDYVQHPNLTWTEIDRGNGYYAYQKKDTNVCMDGGAGGANGQAITLQPCDANDVNQQWEKIDTGNGHYRLQKRGTNFSIDGGAGGNTNQLVYLWTSSNNNQNQQWRFDEIGAAAKSLGTIDSNLVNVYPNPTVDRLTISFDESYGVDAVIQLRTLSGQKLMEVSANTPIQTLDLSSVRSGAYILSVVNGTQIKTIKVIKL